MTPRKKLEQGPITRPDYEALKATVKRHGVTLVISALYDIAFDRAELATSPDEATQWRAASVVLKIAQHELSERNAP